MRRCGNRPTDGYGVAGAFRRGCLSGGILLFAGFAQAQTVPPARVNILLAEDLRAPTPRDLRSPAGARSSRQTAKVALAPRAAERPSVMRPSSRVGPSPSRNRAEAANAPRRPHKAEDRQDDLGSVTPASLCRRLIAALEMEEEASVRAASARALGACRFELQTRSSARRPPCSRSRAAPTPSRIVWRRERVRGAGADSADSQSAQPRAIATLRVFAGLPEASRPIPCFGVPRGCAARR